MKTVMNSHFRWIIFISTIYVLIALSSCDKNSPLISEENNFDLSAYIGNYTIDVKHINGIHSFHDSIGNFLGFGLDTILDIPMQIEIRQHNNTDSLFITGLITDFNVSSCCNKDVLGIVKNDSINLIYNFNTSIDNDYVIGSISFSTDSIFTDYRWDISDTWSSEAFPIYGLVTGSGSK